MLSKKRKIHELTVLTRGQSKLIKPIDTATNRVTPKKNLHLTTYKKKLI